MRAAFVEAFRPLRARSVFVGDGYGVRFSEARTGSFSNTVLSLSALRSHDARPFVVVVVRDTGLEFLLANSTFLKKASHSSHRLTVDNVRGSFNGGDILREYQGLRNSPENFDALFASHAAFTWEENLERLVGATNDVAGRDLRFRPTEEQTAQILRGPERAARVMGARAFRQVGEELADIVRARSDAILRSARVENVNVRGNDIERHITGLGGGHGHRLDDLVREFPGGVLSIDVKTKLLDRASAPKAYNIDKTLAFLATPDSVPAFLMVGIDLRRATVSAVLLPIFEVTLLRATRVQHHWAGRNSRGVTQLTGRFSEVFDAGYRPAVGVDEADAFVSSLLRL
ncbi:hypothetical protein [Streptomyces sp. NPDC047886]|uniref:hypothetical protein n=1 Tax=Streptomyces sp. NPDC047886 TaxID=3365490 RepID=UPI0037242191